MRKNRDFPLRLSRKMTEHAANKKGFHFGTLRKATDDKGFPLGGAVAEGGR